MSESIARQALNHSTFKIVDKIEVPKAVKKSAPEVQITRNKILFQRQGEREVAVKLPQIKQIHETIDGVSARDLQSRQQELRGQLPNLNLFQTDES